ncbi:Glycine cleavage system H protein [uncultured Gammaproteobacteria bacterium]|uniref:glycine cleavage system protein GcvH n=1 Tax=Bathymodiolus heckerae thiotrophic gill symbiont TaxID=1052212 RepID=UPI0010B9E0A1|nr:glycine cleavage system protein GcvH [Bathymodiolus heckerae thiotrophic gill symbiont]CAC9579579.1 Glycine cleavage system H protein [uncultured Gammaproteobacteria bacterium]CAC9607597.1 Glycine cleavage system H protein [uncultured Gammaproteobacteria bacterium]CAC9958489.1 Glycine cleavage system H protein [uncultured Gammaproteobacteria bacterium]SHN89479.1 Glycine cleavage system H protein [Bathymodiolus heckerae thiotrophic gill symbiont]
MSEVRDDRQYTETHEWILDNGDGTFTMGVTDHAQALLGDMVFVELPGEGDEASHEDEFCVVESVKAASGVYAPADLEIVAANEALDDEPELVNSSCYDDGWLVKFKADNIEGLMSAEDYTNTLD